MLTPFPLEFFPRLASLFGLNFANGRLVGADGKSDIDLSALTAKCDHTRTKAGEVAKEMGIDWTVIEPYVVSLGGCCDCAVLLDVFPPTSAVIGVQAGLLRVDMRGVPIIALALHPDTKREPIVRWETISPAGEKKYPIQRAYWHVVGRGKPSFDAIVSRLETELADAERARKENRMVERMLTGIALAQIGSEGLFVVTIANGDGEALAAALGRALAAVKAAGDIHMLTAESARVAVDEHGDARVTGNVSDQVVLAGKSR